MRRPLTDFFSDADLATMAMHFKAHSYICCACEEPIQGDSYHRVTAGSLAMILCPACARAAQTEAIARRSAGVKRPRVTPGALTSEDLKVQDCFSKLTLPKELK